MRIFRIKSNLSLLQKICLAGLFTALTAILQKVLAINYVPGLPFIRLSFGGPALIIVSSILLGPYFGALVGAGSDILGYFIFDMSGSGWFPQITAIYALLGFGAYFIFQLGRIIYSKKAILITEIICLTLFLIASSFFLFKQDVELGFAIGIPAGQFILAVGLVIFTILLDKKGHVELGFNMYQISFSCFLLETIIMLIFGSLMKGWAFGFDIYLLIFICQSIVMFFNIAINMLVVSIMLKLTKRYIRYQI